ncbi:MAG: M3 family oligoendopeptidase [Oscillibacter sp.]|nr:M3 family oligoendopeptidase [Oscillibacter sp.]
MLKRILCLLLALALMSGPAALAVKWEYPASAHPEVDYLDMLPVTPFDETELLAALKELEGVCSRHSRDRDDKQTRRRVQALYERILEEMDLLVTRANLSSIQYDATGGAPEEAARYRELSAQQTRFYDRCYQALSALAASPYSDILDKDAGEGAARSLLGYRGLTEEESALYEEEDLLIQTYDQILSKGVSVQVAGGVWTAESLENAGVDGETYEAVSEALVSERYRAAGEVYLQLVQLRTDLADRAGYDDYASYAYEALYTRDYSLGDAATLREAAKRYILPLQLKLLDTFDGQDTRGLSVRSRKSGEEVLDAIRPFVVEFDREMGETFDFLRRHGLYDIEYGAAKLPTGYTVALPAYGSAFIFNSPYGDYQDLSDMVHEFGHFFETFHCTRHDLWSDFNIDVGEIHSQALELMFTGEAEALFGERYGKVYENTILYNILDSILDGCLYDEFQTAAYQDPEMTVEELNVLFKELSEEYGYSYDPGTKWDPTWVENAHNFQNPLYFISYATSALSALDIWFLYLDNPREARDVYLELSALSLSLPYMAAVEEVGLRDIFDSKTVPALAKTLEAHLNGEKISYEGKSRSVALPVMRGLAVVYILFCVGIIVCCTRFLSRHRGWQVRSGSRRDRRKDGEGDPWSAGDKKPPWEL